MIKQISASLLLAAAVASVPAVAQARYVSRAGSEAWTSGNTVYNKDTAGDDKATGTEYLYNNSNSTGYLFNKSGYGSTTSRDIGATINGIKACVDNGWLPRTCSEQWH